MFLTLTALYSNTHPSETPPSSHRCTKAVVLRFKLNLIPGAWKWNLTLHLAMFHGALFLCCTILIQIIWAALYSVPLQQLREPSTTLSHTRLMNIPPLLLMHTQTLFHRLQWIKNCSSDFSESHKEALNLQLNVCGTRETLGKIAHGDVNVSQGPTETVRERK